MTYARRRFLAGTAAIGGGLLLAPWSTWPQSATDPDDVPLRSATPGGRPKRILICADGTWNEAEKIDPKTGRPQPTNVLKVARGVLPRGTDGIDQVVYYHYGVGTAGGLDEFTGGAFGKGIELNVRQLYRFLVYNYEPGDQLYFFGFSRGAFTVRTLAGFMKKVGLLQKDHEYYTGEIFEFYASTPEEQAADRERFQKIIGKGRPSPPIRFVGVWDTVGALGAPGVIGRIFNRDKYKYHDLALNSYIENAFHALAIDERRGPFAPTLWKRPEGWTGRLEQVWFPGVHSNVGGSYSPDGLANEALHWMVEKAESVDLQFDNRYLAHYKPCFNSRLNKSMTSMYKVMGPHVRPIGENLSDGEAIHQSAIDRMNMGECGYGPSNLQDARAKNPAIPIAKTTRIQSDQACEDRDNVPALKCLGAE